MDELRIDSIRIRSDLVGDYEKSDKLKGYKAEMLLRKAFRRNEQDILSYMQEKYKFSPYVRTLPSHYAEKYKSYLKDKEARHHIYEKYAEKESIIEPLCARLTFLDAKECLRLQELYENSSILYVIDEIMKTFRSELRLLIPDDTTKIKNL